MLNKNMKQLQGFTLVELLVAMVVGLIIVSGAFSLHSTTRKAQVASEAQMDMAADARFAIDMITYDLRHAGMWGGTNKDEVINCKSTAPCAVASSAGETLPADLTGDCASGWHYDLSLPVFATDDSEGNPYSLSCIPSTEGYQAGTDILEVHYANSNPTLTDNLLAGQVYVRSNFTNGRIFVNNTQPVIDRGDADPLTQNHELHAYAYYISNHSDSTGDGIPSLRRVALVNAPSMQNQTLISGVTDLQVQFGVDVDGVVDANGNVTVDRYVDANQVTDWSEVYAAKIWLVMRGDEEQASGVNTVKTFYIAGAEKTPGASDEFRYFMVSSVVYLRNLKKL